MTLLGRAFAVEGRKRNAFASNHFPDSPGLALTIHPLCEGVEKCSSAGRPRAYCNVCRCVGAAAADDAAGSAAGVASVAAVALTAADVVDAVAAVDDVP